MRTISVHFEIASAQDAEDLAALRVIAMRASLERVGRFDPQRARDRFLANFTPASTRHLVVDGHRVGFVVVRHQGDHLLLDHLYVHPAYQGRGVGGAVLSVVLADADAQGMPVRVGALRASESNRFYVRHGFELVESTEWDNYYVRTPVDPGTFHRDPHGRSTPSLFEGSPHPARSDRTIVQVYKHAPSR